MPDPAIQRWLKREATREAADSLLFAVGCVALGGGMLLVTFAGLWTAGWVLGGLTASALSGSGVDAAALPWFVACLVGAGGVVALFLLNARAARALLEARWSRDDRLFGPGRHRRFPALSSLLAYPGAAAHPGLGWLLAGPRLCVMAGAHVRRSVRLRRLDCSDGAWVLLVLLARGRRVPLEELAGWTVLRDPVQVILDLRELPGVLLLQTPPPALTLTGEYRSALADAAGSVVAPNLMSDIERGAAAVQALHRALNLNLNPGRRASIPDTPAAPVTTFTPPRNGLRLAPAGDTGHQPAKASAQPAKGSQQADSPVAPDPRRIWEQHRPPRSTR